MASRSFRYLPAVDGLRALAVGAVVAFHLAPDAVPGGFLGVDTFFVVSGYLITSLLLAEHAADGAIALRAFWARRARRLLPALLLVLCVVAVAAAAWWPAEDLARIRGDALGGLGYVANWRFIAQHDSYFDLSTGPSPLRHLWSLAIEEQFYVVWPLVAAACLRRSARLLGVVSALGAAASVAAMVTVGAGDRAYYGTDTRAHALLIGAALAVALRRAASASTAPPRWLAPVGTLAAALCVGAWWAADESSGWLFTWGFPAYALLTALAVAAVVLAGDGGLARGLAWRPLVATGKVSYGLYLWHWPVIVLLTPARTGLDGVGLGACRLAVAVAGTLASYRLLERPVRFGTRLRGRVARVVTGTALTGTAAVVVLGTAGATPVPEHLRTPGSDGVVAAVSVNDAAVVDLPPSTAAPHDPRRPSRVLLVGDSVAWTVHEELGDVLGSRGTAFASAAIVGCGAAAGSSPAGAVVALDGEPVAWAESCRGAVASTQAQGLATVTPDVVLFHSSWETADRFVDGRIVPYGTPEWDALVLRELGETVDRLSAGGARVAFLTVPPPVPGDQPPRLAPAPERLARYNRLAAKDPRVLVIDLAAVVCGGSVADCPTTVDGVRPRPADGIHYDDAGAAWVAERVADELAAVDLDAPTG